MIGLWPWASPPWQGGTAKHRLGLRPDPGSPLTQMEDVQLRLHKTQQLKENYAAVVACVADGEEAQQYLLDLEPLRYPPSSFPHTIANCALLVEEDLCLLDVRAENRLIAACVCAPSYWRLHEKIGLPLRQVHEPVDGLNAKVGPRVEHFFANLPVGRTFRRENWFVHSSPELYQVNEEHIFDVPAQNWVMRCEYQSLYKLTPKYVLFGIRVVCEPLRHIAMYPSAGQDLLSALQRMDIDEVSHFGGQQKLTALVDVVKELTT